MLDESDREAITEAGRRHGARRILLFGSSALPGVEAADIDIAVEGIPPAKFFEFYGDVMFSVSKPIDVIDLSEKSLFTDIVRRDGVAIYG